MSGLNGTLQISGMWCEGVKDYRSRQGYGEKKVSVLEGLAASIEVSCESMTATCVNLLQVRHEAMVYCIDGNLSN